MSSDAGKQLVCPRCSQRSRDAANYRDAGSVPFLVETEQSEGESELCCAACGGLWIDADLWDERVRELGESFVRSPSKLPKRSWLEQPRARVATATGSSPHGTEEQGLECPNCKNELLRYAYRGRDPELDMCIPCGYVWVDMGELASAGAVWARPKR